MCATKYKGQDELDPTKKAVDILDHFLDGSEEKIEQEIIKTASVVSSVSDELKKDPIVQVTSGRTQSPRHRAECPG